MSLYEKMLLSKVIQDNNFQELAKNGISANHFNQEKEVYNFLHKYVTQQGHCPDFRTVVNETNFEYEQEVVDSVKYLSNKVKQDSSKFLMYNLLQEKASKNFGEMDGNQFTNWLLSETSKIQASCGMVTSLGTDFANTGQERKELYLDRKENKYKDVVPLPWATLDEKLDLELGDYVLLQAYTNRGKSWLAGQMGLSAWQGGFSVLHYSPELTKSQTLLRLDTLLGHFKNSQLKRGELEDEDNYFAYLDSFTGNSSKYTIKTMEDIEVFSLEAIEQDIKILQPNVVIIDGFNLITTKSSNRRDMASNSRRLRQIFGKNKVMGLVVHQTPTSAEKENKLEDDVGNRLPNPAQIHQYSETIAVIQDACTVLSFDQIDGVGQLLVAKARSTCVGETIDLQCDFDNGYIKELFTNDDKELPMF